MKKTIIDFRKMRETGEQITYLTAYDYLTAKYVERAGIDMILVGDSVGNVVHGYGSTIPVSMDEMVSACRAVRKGAPETFIIGDMPFMSYQTSVYDALVNAGRLMKEGRAGAVKLEGGEEIIPQVEAIVKASIPVMGHIGLTPQSINALGGYKAQGRDIDSARKLIKDAKLLEQAGAFSIVLECVPADLATYVSEQLSIPTIGIGGGAGTDGQILVYADMLAMFSDYRPKFVKNFANVGEIMMEGFKAYDAEVKAGTYPAEEHTYAIDPDVLEAAKINS